MITGRAINRPPYIAMRIRVLEPLDGIRDDQRRDAALGGQRTEVGVRLAQSLVRFEQEGEHLVVEGEDGDHPDDDREAGSDDPLAQLAEVLGECHRAVGRWFQLFSSPQRAGELHDAGVDRSASDPSTDDVAPSAAASAAGTSSTTG